MNETISLMFDENGYAKIYDDTFDITIHCESEEEYNKVLEILNRRWIPVSERPPEEDGEYFVTVLDSYSGRPFVDSSHYFTGNVNNNGFYKAYEVIAWMPLPEPYKPQENEDKK